MKFVNVFLALALVACVVFGEDEVNNEAPSVIVNLNAASYSEFISNNDLALVLFYAPWCGHCKAFMPEFERIAPILKEKGVSVARINGDEESAISDSVSVQSFPTIMVYVKGKPIEYIGERSEEGILAFINKVKPVEKKPVEEKPVEEKPEPVEEKPTEEKPVEVEKPVEEKPVEEKPSELEKIEEEIKQYIDAAQDFVMKTWKQYSEQGTQYFETLVPGHGYDIVVSLAVVAGTTVFIFVSLVPCCLCGCCGNRRRNRKSRSPVVLMVGISGSGKTAATSRLVYGEMPETHTSQSENVVPDVDLGEGVRATVVDTPGHERVRSVWHNFVGRNAGSHAATHVVFMVNAVDARAKVDKIAEFLFDVLSDPEVQDEELPVMLLCTKSDMQTALPEKTVIPLIERQLQQLREASQIDAHEQRDIIKYNVDESLPFSFSNAACNCTFASASARTGNLDAIARFVREM